MPLKTTDSGLSADEAYSRLRAFASNGKMFARNYVAELQAGPVDTAFIFTLLDQLRGFINQVTAFVNVAGLDAYATSQSYSGSITADANACNAAAQACINWVVSNFPKDSTGNWILAQSLAADGTRTPRSFSSAQTAGLQTALNNFIATFQ